MTVKVYSSEFHDPVDRIEIKEDPRTGDVYHRGAYYEEWRSHDDSDKHKKHVRAHLSQLSKDPVRRSEQIHWLRKGVNPFQVSSMLAQAASAKSGATRWLAMHGIREFGLLDASCLPVLINAVRSERRQDNQAIALHLISLIEGSRAEDLYIEALESKRFRYKYSPITCIHAHGSARAVPGVCRFLTGSQRIPSKSRAADTRDTEWSFAARFLDRFLDTHPEVEDAFKVVIRCWDKLGFHESNCILHNVRYIGIRVLEPVMPLGWKETSGPVDHLWKNKEQFWKPRAEP